MSIDRAEHGAEDAAVDRAGQLLSQRVGLRLDPGIRGRLARAVLEGAQAHALDASAYGSRLSGDASLLQDLIDRITVQESAFFRDPAQFDALRQHVLPGLVRPPAAAGPARPVRVWSAGCANGQEAYSLAIALADSGCRDWEVTATDISSSALERTRRARYTSREIAGLSPDQRARHLVSVGPEWEVSAPLRDRVRVARQNLVADPPPFGPGDCDIVFCRNVLIYIRYEDVVTFVERVDDWLAPDGWLFLGYSETLWQLTDRFRVQSVGEAFAYRRRASASAAPAADGPPNATTSGTAPGAATRTATWTAPGTAKGSSQPDKRPPPAARGAGVARQQSRPVGAPDEGERGRSMTAPPRADAANEALAAGNAAAAAGDHDAAVRAYRRYAFLDPDQPVAHLRLALALEEIGDTGAARRAYAATRQALARSETAAVEADLEGYHIDELVRLIDAKLNPGAGPSSQ
jgi:chemotaxis methyl-accepting protein methylase